MSQKKFIRDLLNRLLGNTRLLLFLIVLLGLSLRLVFFSGMGTSDDLGYSRYAANLDKIDNNDEVLTLSTRLGMVYATAFSYKLFGISDFSSILFVLIVSIANIILIFYFGKLLFSEKIGLMAAFLLSFFPLEVVYATKLFSDLPSAFFMSLGIYSFLYSEIKPKLRYNIGYIMSGFFIGVGYLFRESAVLIALFFLCYIAYKKKIKKTYFLVPLGFAIVLAAEMIFFYTLSSDPLFRLHASQDYLAKSTIAHDYFGRLDFPQGLFHYPYIILADSLISVYYIIILMSIIYFALRKKVQTYYPMFWFVSLLLYLSFGSASLTQYIPFKATARYLEIVTIPGILLVSFFLAESYSTKKRLIMFLTLFLLVTSIIFVYLRNDRNQLHDLRVAYEGIKGVTKPVYADDRSLRALAYVAEYSNGINVIEYSDSLSQVRDSYIIINKRMIKGLKDANKSRVFPDEIENPPKRWVLVNEIGLNNEEKVIIYYAP